MTLHRSGSWGSLQLPSNSSCPALTQVWGLFVPHPPEATQIWVCPNADRARLECGVCERLQATPPPKQAPPLSAARASWTEKGLDCQGFKGPFQLPPLQVAGMPRVLLFLHALVPFLVYRTRCLLYLYIHSHHIHRTSGCLSLSEGVVEMGGASGQPPGPRDGEDGVG